MYSDNSKINKDAKMLEEQQLMTAIKNGEVRLVGILFERYHLAIFNFFIRLGISRSEAEDFVQETFIRIIKYRNSYDDKSAFSCWCYQIARNIAFDHFKNPRNKIAFCEFDEDTAVETSTVQDTDLYEDQQARLQLALSRLPFEQREIIVLSRYQQIPYKEISTLLDCNMNTLKTRIRAALIALKKQFDQLSTDNHE